MSFRSEFHLRARILAAESLIRSGLIQRVATLRKSERISNCGLRIAISDLKFEISNRHRKYTPRINQSSIAKAEKSK